MAAIKLMTLDSDSTHELDYETTDLIVSKSQIRDELMQDLVIDKDSQKNLN